MVTLEMIKDAKERVRNLKKDYAYQEAKFKVGDEVYHKNRMKAFKVTGITYHDCLGELVFHLTNLLKDGRTGAKQINISGESIDRIVIKTN